MENKILRSGLYCALGTSAYIALVAVLLSNANALFGKMTGIIAPVAFLLLFVVSAAITGTLVLGRPLMLYLDGAKKDAVRQLIATIAWLAVILIVFLLVLASKASR